MLAQTKPAALALPQEQPQILVLYIQVTPPVISQTNERNVGLLPVPSCSNVENKPK